MPRISVIIPTLNAAPGISKTLASAEASPLVSERLVVDGGSADETVSVAVTAGAQIIEGSPRGRGMQLAAGAAAAHGDWFLFLHADTVLEEGWAAEAERFIDQHSAGNCAAAFRFSLDDQSTAARRLESIVAWRCRYLGLPYGDQGLLISRRFYEEIGGFKPLPIFEDVNIVRRIGRARLVMLNSRAVTSAARYRKSGYLRRPLRNLVCLALYGMGVAPHRMVRFYGGKS